MAPYQMFAASDGHPIMATGNESQYHASCNALGVPELGDAPRFASNRLRVTHREKRVAILAVIMRHGHTE